MAQPSAASATAMARPIPDPPPVMIATLLSCCVIASPASTSLGLFKRAFRRAWRLRHLRWQERECAGHSCRGLHSTSPLVQLLPGSMMPLFLPGNTGLTKVFDRAVRWRHGGIAPPYRFRRHICGFRAGDHSSGKLTRFVCNPSMAAFFKYVAGLSYFILEDARAGLYQWRTCRASHSITREEAPGRVPVGRAGVSIVDGGNEILGS